MRPCTLTHVEHYALAFRKWYTAQITRDPFFTGTEPVALDYGVPERIAALYRAHVIRTVDREFALGVSTGQERGPQTTPNDAPSAQETTG